MISPNVIVNFHIILHIAYCFIHSLQGPTKSLVVSNAAFTVKINRHGPFIVNWLLLWNRYRCPRKSSICMYPVLSCIACHGRRNVKAKFCFTCGAVHLDQLQWTAPSQAQQLSYIPLILSHFSKWFRTTCVEWIAALKSKKEIIAPTKALWWIVTYLFTTLRYWWVNNFLKAL